MNAAACPCASTDDGYCEMLCVMIMQMARRKGLCDTRLQESHNIIKDSHETKGNVAVRVYEQPLQMAAHLTDRGLKFGRV